MVEPFGGPLPIPFDQHSDHPDAKTVHENGDRNRRDDQHHSLPHPILEEKGTEQRKSGERKQIPNAAAGFAYLKLNWPQIDHIALTKGRHANKLQEPPPESRGPQLKLARQTGIQENRQWDAGQQISERKGNRPRPLDSHQRNDQSHNDHPERNMLQDIQRGELTDPIEEEARRNHSKAPP